MSEAFLIREAQAADYAGMCKLFGEVDALHAERAPWMFRTPLSEPRSAEFLANQLSHADSTLFVADAGELVGVATVVMRSAPEFGVFVPQRWAVLDGIAVTRAWQRRGVGRALTGAAEGWARTQGARWVELVVYDFNANARAFYEALGYLPTSMKLRKPMPE